MTSVNLILAVDANYGIAETITNTMPWRTKNLTDTTEDMRRFKKLTTNTNVVMGAKTFKECGYLPSRNNFVLSMNKPFNTIPFSWNFLKTKIFFRLFFNTATGYFLKALCRELITIGRSFSSRGVY